MRELDLFTESNDFARLLIYDAWKLVPTRAILGFCMEKTPKNWLFEIFGNRFLATNWSKNLYFWFLGKILWISSDVQSRIMDVLFFVDF